MVNKKKNELLELIDKGYIKAIDAVNACLAYMSEEDVAKMMHNNEFGYKFFGQEEEIDHQSDDEDFDYLAMDLESDLDGD